MFELSICIVNHRTPVLLAQCLRSIHETAGALALEIYVVNNTPERDDRLEALAAEFPAVNWMLNEAPLGFAANQNQMLQRASGRHLMPLNSDTRLLPGALQALVSFMDAHPRVGIAGPKLLRPDGRLQPSCRNYPNAATHFLEASGLWQLFRGNRLIGRWYYLCSPHSDVREVDWLTGACLIVRASAAQQVGYFDADRFGGLYGEDIDWCWRMRRAGWQIAFDPGAEVIHLENQSALDDRALHMYRGFYAFCTHAYSRRRQWSIWLATQLALFPKRLLARNPQQRATYASIMALKMPEASSAPDTRMGRAAA